MEELWVQGDLNQMGLQKKFLLGHHIALRMQDVYPVVKAEHAEAALRLIWSHKVEGWWHYSKQYLKYNICTKEQYDQASAIA
jgi:hypothetical protein